MELGSLSHAHVRLVIANTMLVHRGLYFLRKERGETMSSLTAYGITLTSNDLEQLDVEYGDLAGYKKVVCRKPPKPMYQWVKGVGVRVFNPDQFADEGLRLKKGLFLLTLQICEAIQ